MRVPEWRNDPRLVSLIATVALHAAAGFALLQLDAVRKPLQDAIPLMVDLIVPPRVEPPPPPPSAKVQPPKPRPVAREPVPQPPQPQPQEAPPALLAAQSTAPAAGWTAPATPPQAAPVAPAPPAPPRIVPPSFDAAYLKNPPPAYPRLSRRQGEKGKVILRVHVTPEGLADQVQVRTSSGFERLDEAAAAAVRQWRFAPARQGEVAVAAWVLVPIMFSLED
jgi:protein TonB